MSAIDVAGHLLRLAGAEVEPEEMTQMRLHKLLYYVQGWHLAIFGTPLFQDRIEAWRDGPVVKPIRKRFKEFGSCSIPHTECVEESKPLPSPKMAFVKRIWDEYKKHSVFGLRDMTHKESPWILARGKRSPSESGSDEITRASMLSHFRKELHHLGMSPDDVRKAYIGCEQAKKREYRSGDEVFSDSRKS